MTEREWFGITDAHALVRSLPDPHYRNRKLRLFAAACCSCARRKWSQPFVALLAEVERLADERTNQARSRLKQLRRESCREHTLEGRLIWQLAGLDAHITAIRTCIWLTDSVWWWRNTRTNQVFVRLLRDVIGNPFRAQTLARKWRTETAALIARQMYESRDFSAMPILADALQDAGCDSDEVLSHCRDPEQVHVCGCWVVDLVLGKT